ncbi:MAG: acyltransferase family protein [Lachnospiraceae bacterium]|nr:acyltransferase family protein [Lachnospiraceae bacterium]
MNAFLMIIFVLILYEIKPCVIKNNEAYLSVKDTNAIKGIFIMFVFFRHITSYISDFEALDLHMLNLNYYLDQLIVVMFLFYSGYGVSYSIRNKENYMAEFLKKRIGYLLIEFDIIVLIYYVVGRIIGKAYSMKRLLLSVIGLQSVGNSNWYIFSIIIMYFITFISYRLFKKSKVLFLMSHVVLTVIYIMIIMQFKETFWYNTVFAYVFGIFWGEFKDDMDKILSREYLFYLIFAANLIIYHYSRKYSANIILYELMSISFALFILLVTRKIKFGNTYLIFLGKNLFPLYILQRLPMLVLKSKTNALQNNTVFMLYSMILTIILTQLYLYLKNFLKR